MSKTNHWNSFSLDITCLTIEFLPRTFRGKIIIFYSDYYYNPIPWYESENSLWDKSQ